jgi:hypothetical protein
MIGKIHTKILAIFLKRYWKFYESEDSFEYKKKKNKRIFWKIKFWALKECYIHDEKFLTILPNEQIS